MTKENGALSEIDGALGNFDKPAPDHFRAFAAGTNGNHFPGS